MALKFKPGVRLQLLQPQMLIALQVVEEEFSRFSTDTVVTSANDSTHKEGSYHYAGRAFDFRTKHASGIAGGIVGAIKQRLGPLGFDCIWEGQNTDNEHLHIEYDPKA
jgi:hypothetical protein